MKKELEKHENWGFLVSEEKYYCKKDRHPCLEEIRLERDEKLWRDAIDCPHICCAFCSKCFSCAFACWVAQTWKKSHPSRKCKYQCTLQEKVFGKIMEKKKDEDWL